MVATPSLTAELQRSEDSENLGMWTRGVDTDLFSPDRAIELDLPRPIFISVGRIAVEKNLEAFLSLDLPGTKVVIGTGPQEAELRQRFPDAKFLGLLENGKLSGHLAAADVFVFPSRTDTFGVVQLEALASGVPVAAFPVTGPKDVIANQSDRRAERGPAGGLPRCVEDVAPGLPRLRAGALLGEQRAAVRRQHQTDRAGQRRPVARCIRPSTATANG